MHNITKDDILESLRRLSVMMIAGLERMDARLAAIDACLASLDVRFALLDEQMRRMARE